MTHNYDVYSLRPTAAVGAPTLHLNSKSKDTQQRFETRIVLHTPHTGRASRTVVGNGEFVVPSFPRVVKDGRAGRARRYEK